MLKVTLPDDVSDWTEPYRKLRLRDTWDFPEAEPAASVEKRRQVYSKSCYYCIGKHST